MTIKAPFCPDLGSNQIVTVAAATPTPLNINRNAKQVRVCNGTTTFMHARTYNSTGTVPNPTSSTADYAIAPNSVSIFTKDHSHDRLSLFSTAGGLAHACTGEGF